MDKNNSKKTPSQPFFFDLHELKKQRDQLLAEKEKLNKKMERLERKKILNRAEQKKLKKRIRSLRTHQLITIGAIVAKVVGGELNFNTQKLEKILNDHKEELQTAVMESIIKK